MPEAQGGEHARHTEHNTGHTGHAKDQSRPAGARETAGGHTPPIDDATLLENIRKRMEEEKKRRYASSGKNPDGSTGERIHFDTGIDTGTPPTKKEFKARVTFLNAQHSEERVARRDDLIRHGLADPLEFTADGTPIWNLPIWKSTLYEWRNDAIWILKYVAKYFVSKLGLEEEKKQ